MIGEFITISTIILAMYFCQMKHGEKLKRILIMAVFEENTFIKDVVFKTICIYFSEFIHIVFVCIMVIFTIKKFNYVLQYN